MKNLEKLIEFEKGIAEEKTQVFYSLYQFGRDLILFIGGGEFHLGAVSISNRRSQKGSDAFQHVLKSHREDKIVEQAFQELRKLVTCEILVAGGIHYDDISLAQIHTIQQHCQELLEEVKGWLEKSTFSK